jgi:hypothetical protein
VWCVTEDGLLAPTGRLEREQSQALAENEVLRAEAGSLATRATANEATSRQLQAVRDALEDMSEERDSLGREHSSLTQQLVAGRTLFLTNGHTPFPLAVTFSLSHGTLPAQRCRLCAALDGVCLNSQFARPPTPTPTPTPTLSRPHTTSATRWRRSVTGSSRRALG